MLQAHKDTLEVETSRDMIARMVRDFGRKEILPYRMEWDEKQVFPSSLFKAIGELGLMGVLVPERYGGSGFGYIEYVTAIEELAKLDGSVGLSMAAHNSLCTGHILQFGSEEQKHRYLPQLATGKQLGAWALTEPNTGSDAGNMDTVATDEGDHYVITGAKNFITHGLSGDVMVVIARTGEKKDSRGMTAFILEKGAPGLSAGKKENKMGMRASETTAVVLDRCKVPKSQVIGKVGEGFIQALSVLDGGRISIAALSMGIAQGAFETALSYAQERKQFDKPIAHFQGISFKLAEMSTEIEAARMLTLRAADMKNRGQDVQRESAMAKLYASETAVKVANEAVQILGGYGYIKDFPVEKFYRDAKLCTIGEGTSEIQKLVISRTLLK